MLLPVLWRSRGRSAMTLDLVECHAGDWAPKLKAMASNLLAVASNLVAKEGRTEGRTEGGKEGRSEGGRKGRKAGNKQEGAD